MMTFQVESCIDWAYSDVKYPDDIHDEDPRTKQAPPFIGIG